MVSVRGFRGITITFPRCGARRACFLFGVLAAFLALSAPAGANPRYAAIVVDATDGRTLFQSHADARRYPASLTKIMTLYLVFEELKAGRLTLDSALKVSAHAAARPPSKIGLPAGATIRVEDAIKALVTKSANDIAVVVAENIAGSEAAFARRMTRTARRLGMHSTTFRNASGLPDPDQVTTARDMARLGLAVQRDHPRYYGFFKTRTFTYRGHSYPNHNRLLGRVEGVDGIKTGFIQASGFNLVTSVRRDDRHIVAVVMGGRSGHSRNEHMKELISAWLPKAATGAGRAPIFLAGRPIPRPTPKPYGRILTAVIEQSLVPDAAVPPADPDAIIDRFDIASIRQGAAQQHPRLRVEAPPPPVARTGGDGRRSAPRTVKTIRILAGAAAEREEDAVPVGAIAYAPEPTEYGSADTPDPARPYESDDGAAVPPGWHIQVAATTSQAEAIYAIEAVRREFPDLLGERRHATMRVDTRTATLWRARFVGFPSQAEAEATCRTLVDEGQACWAEAM